LLPQLKALNRIKELMSGPPENYTNIERILLSENLLVETDDGTMTIRSELDSELMHSTIGASREAFEKFVFPSELEKLEQPKILDLCSGLGYNSLAALIQNNSCLIDMLEISPEIIFLSRYLNNRYNEKLIINDAVDCFFKKKPFKRIQILCDDARILLNKSNSQIYDVVFHDGFSPANDPILYTVDFLSLLFKSMKNNAVLLSYSSSIPFRSALIESGFYVGEGPSIGRKRGITIAAKAESDQRLKSRLSFSDEKLIALSSIGLPYRDRNLSGDSNEIIEERNSRRDTYKKLNKDLSTKKIKKNLIDEKYFTIYNHFSSSRDSVLAMKKYLFDGSEYF